MAKNTGTLITSTIRPNDSLDQISVAFTNEIKGGLHSYETKSELFSIIQARRQWGMKAVIYNDGSNDGTYLLKYGFASSNIMDNNNWVLDSTSGGSEWIDSIISVSDGTIYTTNDGDRYLVSSSSAFYPFDGQENKISIFYSSLNGGSGGWDFSIPTTGQTLRVDNEPNVIYKYQGTWSSGSWVKEYLNQVRYINPTSLDGLTYSYTTIGQTPVDSYSFSQYESVFSMTNSGTVSLSIDGLEYVEVKKLSSNQLVTLSASDIVPNVNYTLVYNNGIFQANIQSTTGIIGPAEDGDYSDGLYTDLNSSTPIGVPIDRFNEVLKALVPPSAPNLSTWGSNINGISSKLSFNSTTSGFSSATQSPYGGVDFNGLFSPSGFRLGVFSASGVLSGTISSGVSLHPSTPSPAYVAFSFGKATSGTMSLFLNGSTVSSVSLATQSTINTTGGLTGGLILSAPTSSKFPSGVGFEQFQNRTGTWQISLTNPGLRDGYNWVDLIHDVSPQTFTVSRFEFVLDRGASRGVTFSSPQLSSPVWSGATKSLSGIQYYSNITSTASTINYTCDLDNLYANTYNTSTSALTIRDTNSIWGISGSSTYSFPIPVMTTSNPEQNILISATFSLLPNKRRFNEPVIFNTTAVKSFGQQFTSGTESLSNLFIDTFGTSSTTLLYEDFCGEDYRLKNSGSYSSTYDLLSGVTSSVNKWDSTESLVGNDALMIANGRLMYPTLDFGSTGSIISNPNFNGGASVDYTNLGDSDFWSTTAPNSSYRVYTRWFQFTGPTRTNMLLSITSSSPLSFVKVGSVLGVSDGYLECKLPLSSGKTGAASIPPNTINTSTQATGWMDCSQGADGGKHGNTDGCLVEPIDVSGNNTTRTITFGGSGGTEKSEGYVLLRITLSSTSTVNILSIQIS
jgi:hypothetical protein